jgi:hypothetical protein
MVFFLRINQTDAAARTDLNSALCFTLGKGAIYVIIDIKGSQGITGASSVPIYFYSTQGEYGSFSNFSRHDFELDGKHWRTVEHYFQAQKFAGTEHETTVRLAPTPKKAAEIGRRRDLPLRRDWEQVKDAVMLRAVLQKFETHADLQAILLNTGDEVLIEKTTHDYYWGCGTDGSGRNQLGKTLMQVRTLLRERTTP